MSCIFCRQVFNEAEILSRQKPGEIDGKGISKQELSTVNM